MYIVDECISKIDCCLTRGEPERRQTVCQKGAGMKINGITLYRTTEAGRYFHAHPYYQLHFILSGVGSYEIAGRCAIKARPELFFVVPPNRLHRISLPGNRPLLEYLIDMAPEADDDPVKKLLDSELGGAHATGYCNTCD